MPKSKREIEFEKQKPPYFSDGGLPIRKPHEIPVEQGHAPIVPPDPLERIAAALERSAMASELIAAYLHEYLEEEAKK